MSRDLLPVTGKQSAGPSNSAANGRVVPPAGQPGHGEFTASLRRQRVPQAGWKTATPERSRSAAATAGITRSWVTPRSRGGCSSSAARTTRSTRALPPTRSTLGWPTDRGRRAFLRGLNPALGVSTGFGNVRRPRASANLQPMASAQGWTAPAEMT
jgi:hypothetical protein